MVGALQVPRRGCGFLPALYAIWFRMKPLPAENLDATRCEFLDRPPDRRQRPFLR
jgi:hypothetical protein